MGSGKTLTKMNTNRRTFSTLMSKPKQMYNCEAFACHMHLELSRTVLTIVTVNGIEEFGRNEMLICIVQC